MLRICGLRTLERAVDYGPFGPVDFPARCARAHISAPAGAMDYARSARCGLVD